MNKIYRTNINLGLCVGMWAFKLLLWMYTQTACCDEPKKTSARSHKASCAALFSRSGTLNLTTTEKVSTSTNRFIFMFKGEPSSLAR